MIPQAIRHSLPRENVLAIRAAYAANELSVAAICTQFEVSSGTLYYWVAGGPPGEQQLPPLPRRKDSVARAGHRRQLGGNRSALVKRMWRTAEAQVREIEKRLASNPPEPLERERDARVFAVLAKTLRELSALDESKQDKQTIAPADDDAVPRDMDELRRSLARKLEALVAGETAALPGKS